LSHIALKADQSPPFWYRDSVTLQNLLEGAWEKVSPEFVQDLLAAFKANDQAKIKKLIKTLPDLGSQMAEELGKAPDAVFSKLLSKAETFWTLHAKDIGIEKPVTIREKYRELMAKEQARQIKDFVEKYPERILEPEIVKQLEYLQATKAPDALTITSITDRLEMLEKSEEYWSRLSDVQVARAWHADGVRYANENGIKTGIVTGPGPDDPDTCPVCAQLFGVEIEIDAMMGKVDSDLNIEDPDEYAAAWSFPRLLDVDNIDKKELGALMIENGWFPPFHPHCRHAIVWLYMKDQGSDEETQTDEIA
jgi:hypothetical protein